MLAQDFEAKRLFHGLSNPLPSVGSKGYFIDDVADLLIHNLTVRTLESIDANSAYLFQTGRSCSKLFYLLPEATIEPYSSIEQARNLLGHELRRYQTSILTEVTMIIGIYMEDELFFSLGCGETYSASELLGSDFRIDGEVIGVRNGE